LRSWKHKGDLWLNGLNKLSDAAAESLSNLKGGLYLMGITELSDAGLKSISKHEGQIDGMPVQKWVEEMRESLN